jgi:hypothetical protein
MIFRSIFIKLTFLVVLILWEVLCYLYLFKNINLISWAVPVGSIIACIGMKLAAPKLPTNELAYLILFIAALPIFTELIFGQTKYHSVFILILNGITPFICVNYFGQRWVSRGYMPPRANWW